MSAITTLWAVRVRRDLVQLLSWIIGIALLAMVTAAVVPQSYGTTADRRELLATVLANPVIMLFRGLPSGAGAAAFTFFLILPFLVFLAALMNSFLAVRHIRAEEESGRAELIGATPASRRAPLIATVVHAVTADIALMIVTTVACIASGLPSGPSLLAASAVGLGGLSFFAVSLCAAEVFATARAANGAGVVVIVGTFLVAGVGNALGSPSTDLTRIESSALTWFSPFGWAELVRPGDADTALPLILCVALAVVATGVAASIHAVRDPGESLIPERRGRAKASAALRGPVTLVGRLTWGAILAWSIGGLFTGMLSTSLASVVQQMGDDNPAIRTILSSLGPNRSLESGTLVIFFTLVGILAACCAVQVAVRARQEEAHGTIEPIWAAAVGRRRWLSGYLLLGATGIIAVSTAAVVGAALGTIGRDVPATLLRDAALAGAGQLLAAAVFLALSAVLVVALPRWSIAGAWTLVMLATVVGLFGALFHFPDALVHASPFASAPAPGSDGLAANGAIWLGIVTVAGTALALGLVRRRPIVTAG